MRVLFAALCIAALACRDRGMAPRLDAVEPSALYNDEASVLLLRGSFEPPVKAALDDLSRSSLTPYSVQLLSGDLVIDLPGGAFRGPERIETVVEARTPAGVYTVRLTDPWGRSTSLADAVTVRGRFGAIPGNDPPINIDPPAIETVRAPPRAWFVFVHGDDRLDRAISVVSAAVYVDGSGSTDTQTLAADLRVSWNFSGNPISPPWPEWTTTKTARGTFSRGGVTTVAMAVIDADEQVGHVARAISVVSDPTDLCFVTTALPGDNGDATDCTPAGSGLDGLLSLDEAVRIANTAVGDQTIVLSAPSELAPVVFKDPEGSAPVPLRLKRMAQIVGAPGAIIAREIIAENGPITLIGVEVAAPGKVTIPHGYTLVLLDSRIRDTNVLVAGHLMVERTRFERCDGACITVNGLSADLVVSESSFAGAGSGDGIDVRQCNSNGTAFSMELVGNTFSGFATGIRVGSGCDGSTRIVHQTFHGNGTGVDYLGGDGHVLRNNIFTAQQVAAVGGCDVPFASEGRRDHLLYGNASDGCLATDTGVVIAHPLYVSSADGDFRLREGSPAVNAAPPLDIDVNGRATNDYLGVAPDFGGRETY
ncbi:MAG TPA: hypothetical protein VE549_14870 [Myxococcaceae bacterium]|nr:hypothetical protein [Myxococcaceae bacterium]